MTLDQRRGALEAIADEVRNCTLCPLHVGRTNAVPGEGSPNTEVVFVGEGPGYNEDQQGRPFVGAAGTLLNELIKAIGWRREDVFITNVVKCRPPGNRDPEPFEIETCAPYLRRQLAVLDPALVVTLGRHSLQTFMPGARIGQSHGTIRPVDPETGARDASVLAMYHPAAALRQHALRETMLEDMTAVPRALIDSRARRSQSAPAAQGDPAGSPIAQPETPPGPAIERPQQQPPGPVMAAEPLPEAAPVPTTEATPAAEPIPAAAPVPTADRTPAAELEPAGVTAGEWRPPDDNQMELF